MSRAYATQVIEHLRESGTLTQERATHAMIRLFDAVCYQSIKNNQSILAGRVDRARQSIHVRRRRGVHVVPQQTSPTVGDNQSINQSINPLIQTIADIVTQLTEHSPR